MTPLTIDFLKVQLMIASSDHDSTLRALLDDAIEVWEQRTGRMIRQRSLSLSMEGFCDVMLPYVPVASVTNVEYRDSAGALQTVSASSWYTSRSKDPFVVVRWKDGVAFPSDYMPGTVTYNYVVGGAAVPPGQARAIVQLVGHWFNNPEAASPVELKAIPYSLDMLVASYSVKGGGF